MGDYDYFHHDEDHYESHHDNDLSSFSSLSLSHHDNVWDEESETAVIKKPPNINSSCSYALACMKKYDDL